MGNEKPWDSSSLWVALPSCLQREHNLLLTQEGGLTRLYMCSRTGELQGSNWVQTCHISYDYVTDTIPYPLRWALSSLGSRKPKLPPDVVAPKILTGYSVNMQSWSFLLAIRVTHYCSHDLTYCYVYITCMHSCISFQSRCMYTCTSAALLLHCSARHKGYVLKDMLKAIFFRKVF